MSSWEFWLDQIHGNFVVIFPGCRKILVRSKTHHCLLRSRQNTVYHSAIMVLPWWLKIIELLTWQREHHFQLPPLRQIPEYPWGCVDIILVFWDYDIILIILISNRNNTDVSFHSGKILNISHGHNKQK